jgi:CDP-diacylglycerol--glycerol-3-phosphate 3-phosphatidyltransferase
MIRLVLVPGLLGLAFANQPSAFLLLFALCLFTDFLDGFLARRLHAQSEWGARLDSWADALSWIAFTCSALLLWPDLMISIQTWVSAALAAFLIPGLYGLFKYHRLPGFHTWSAKAAMAGMGVSVLLLFGGFSPIPFYASVILLGVVCVEETLMVHWLAEPRSDLRSAVQAWRLRNTLS